MLQVQTQAPEFTAVNQDNKVISLKEYKGKYVVLYFYPKDDTTGCTTEACTLRDNYQELQKYAVVMGVSGDSVTSHKAFAEKYHLPFILLADTNKDMIKAYEADGVFTKRITYLINPERIIVKTYPKVNPLQHAEEIIKDLKLLYSIL